VRKAEPPQWFEPGRSGTFSAKPVECVHLTPSDLAPARTRRAPQKRSARGSVKTRSTEILPSNAIRGEAENDMKIKLSSVIVDDQDKAVKFYTEVLGFVKKTDIPLGKFRWLTVVSPEGSSDIELVLEPNENRAAKAFQKALFQQGIPLTAFESADIEKECERLKRSGVVFRTEPTVMGDVKIAAFEDTCGNLIQLFQH
jgi:predicted enzyme related to lactoylglutathione lyase